MSGFPASFLSEGLLRPYVDLLVRVVEAAGALIIFVGALIALVSFSSYLSGCEDDAGSG